MLIIHPEDSTTKFLEELYRPYLTISDDNEIHGDNWRKPGLLINKRVSRSQINRAISNEVAQEEFGSVLLLGHGTTNGLLGIQWGLSINRKGSPILVVGESEIDSLRGHKSKKAYENQDRELSSSLIGIWCYANEFAEKHKLHGLFSGMIISEINEALDFGFNVGRELIEETNSAFCRRLGNLLNKFYHGEIDLSEIPGMMKSYIELDGYTFGVGGHPIISYNYSNLYYY
jgi:hypothetical protein